LELSGPFELDEAARRDGARHIELLRNENRRRMTAGVPSGSPESFSVLGIVGAGMMGTSIGAAAVACGIDVVITDSVETTLHDAEKTIAASAHSDYPRTASIGRITATPRLEDVVACDAVIESIVEEEVRKGSLLKDLDQRMPPSKLLATNTSTIPISRLARGLQNPERLCGSHFFHPVPERLALEMILTEVTSPVARASTVRLATALGRDVLPAPDAVGFVVNRLMLPYVSEAMQLLTEGVEPERIEQVAVDFGMPKGPLTLLDEIGLDTALACGWVFAGAYEDRIAVSPILVSMVKAGRLGRKSGAGFFRYAEREVGKVEQRPDPEAAELVARWSSEEAEFPAEDIAARLFLPMVFEGARMLEEHEGCLAGHVDLGVVLGLGMAPSRGGPLFWADRVGAGRIVQMSEPLKSHGYRMMPPARLREMAGRGQTFHGHTDGT
jgi:3-hydroxyacyl-CoA dehydrogenase